MNLLKLFNSNNNLLVKRLPRFWFLFYNYSKQEILVFVIQNSSFAKLPQVPVKHFTEIFFHGNTIITDYILPL